MRTSIARQGLLVMAGALLVGGLAACGGSDDAKAGAAKDAVAGSAAKGSGSKGAANSDGRSFGASNDTVVKAAEAAISGSKAKWDGKTLLVTLQKGSKEDIGATIYCSAMQSVLGKDDKMTLVYPDGKADCATVLADRS